jgi:TonB family protein
MSKNIILILTHIGFLTFCSNSFSQNLSEDVERELKRKEILQRMIGTHTAQNYSLGTVSYAQILVQKIKPNIIVKGKVESGIAAEVEINSSEDGRITSYNLIKSSGNKIWDDAVLDAVFKTQSLPLDANGKVPGKLIVIFRP